MKRGKSSSFLLELPLEVNAQQAKRVRAHLEAARCLYNALLSEARSCLQRMRLDPAWDAARALPRSQKAARTTAFAHLRTQYGFSEYALHEYAKRARCTWICGIGPVQRDLYSAFLAAYLEPNRILPSITQADWAGVQTRLMAVMESLSQCASAGHRLPQSFGLTRAGACRPQSLAPSHQEPPVGPLIDATEAVGLEQEPPRL